MKQIAIWEYLENRRKSNICGCDGCICKNCLYWWTGRCSYGECYDDYRAEHDPYDKAHPDKSPRTGWSNGTSQESKRIGAGVVSSIISITVGIL